MKYVSSGSERKVRRTLGIGAASLFAGLAILGLWLGGTSEDTGSTSSTRSQSSSSYDNANADKACSAMSSADSAVASLARKVASGSATSADTSSVKSSLKRVNAAYVELEGDFYFYLVGQGNAMDFLVRSVSAGDFYSAGVAVQSYLDGDKYSAFCR